ncbi:MAG: SPOR domain-containing protein, partial [Myxococcota bacterium]
MIEALLPSVPGFCVQVRSVEERAEAERVAQAIHEKLAEDVVLLAKDLGERGVWWRVCVGTAATEEEARRAGEHWTASTGPLAPFLVEASPGQARFLVLSREGRPRHRPTLAMAETLLRARSRSERPPVLFVVAGSLYGGVAFGNEDGTGAGVVIVDGDGAIRPVGLSAPAAPW